MILPPKNLQRYCGLELMLPAEPSMNWGEESAHEPT
jgi:hypothetical protein